MNIILGPSMLPFLTTSRDPKVWRSKSRNICLEAKLPHRTPSLETRKKHHRAHRLSPSQHLLLKLHSSSGSTITQATTSLSFPMRAINLASPSWKSQEQRKQKCGLTKTSVPNQPKLTN